MKKIVKKIIITGTHTTPAIELINQLQKDEQFNWEIYYIGRCYNSSVSTQPSIESKLIPEVGVKFLGIQCGKLDRRWLLNTIRGIPQIFTGFQDANSIIKKIKPDIVVSFGGYVSVPVVIAAKLNHIKSITHEQTFTTSLSTKINSFFVDKIALSFPSKKNNPKEIVTGNLLRQDIYNLKSKLFENLIQNKKRPIIYITAGNQGSKILNDSILSILPDLKKFTIIHQTGETEYSKIKQFSINQNNYHVFDYIKQADIGWVLNHADIIISRSGANTTQEIIALNKKCILIPLPVSQQNEQILNAKWVRLQLPKTTTIIYQQDLTPKKLLNKINQTYKIKTKETSNKSQKNLALLNLIHETI